MPLTEAKQTPFVSVIHRHNCFAGWAVFKHGDLPCWLVLPANIGKGAFLYGMCLHLSDYILNTNVEVNLKRVALTCTAGGRERTETWWLCPLYPFGMHKEDLCCSLYTQRLAYREAYCLGVSIVEYLYGLALKEEKEVTYLLQ